jgi:PDZ domain-containing secreted protein/Zn-dependent protease
MQSSFPLFRVRGIPIGANWTWLAVAVLFVFELGSEFHTSDPGLRPSAYIAMGVITVLLFFASLVLHELGHAFRALREGMEIEGITLWLFGGVARFKGMFPSAGAEFRIAIAGPAVTAVISAVLYGATALLHTVGVHGPVVAVTEYLASINLILLVFNLIPALPLDGGRVYRSYLWYRRNDFGQATVQAARTSRALSAAMIGLGVIGFLRGFPAAIWPAFIGIFLFQAAKGELAFATFRQALGGYHVRDIMTPEPETVDIDTSIARFLDGVLQVRAHSTYPVTQLGRFVGLVSVRRAAEVPVMDRLSRRIRDVMVPGTEVATTTPDADVTDVVAKLTDPSGRIVVIDGERVAGIVSPADISRAVRLGQLRTQAGPPGGRPRGRGFPIAGVLVAVIVLAGGGLLIHPPVAVIGPGASYDVAKDITIEDVKTTPIHGAFLLTSVSVSQPNVFGWLAAELSGREVTALSAVVPNGVNQNKFFEDQKAEFRQSEQFAAAAAAKAAGLKVGVTGTGAQITQVTPGSPAARSLKTNDVIVAINGKTVHVTDDVGTTIRTRPAGTTFDLTVERAKKQIHVTVPSTSGLPGTHAPAIGVLLATRDYSVELPFKIHFKHEDIGGPSAGTAYALAIYDMLSPRDVANGRRIAATGTIDVDGDVGPIGGIVQKAEAARKARATWFVVPQSEASDLRHPQLHIVPVTTLQQAIDKLRS